ncbi:MAG: autotransporter-associated beta strand repeat-containing protein [Planctomycetaceae bacterium]
MITGGATGNTVGGATAAFENVISGNTGYAIFADGAATINNSVLNNLVGVKADQSGNLANGTGALSIANSAVVIAGGTFNGAVSDGGTLDLNGNGFSIVGALTGLGTVTNTALSGTATLTVDGTATFAGVIQDGATASTALFKAGTGTFTLSGANTYSGATSVQAGSLRASHTSALESYSVS